MGKGILFSSAASGGQIVIVACIVILVVLTVLLCLAIIDRRIHTLTMKVDDLAKQTKKIRKLAKKSGAPAQKNDTLSE